MPKDDLDDFLAQLALDDAKAAAKPKAKAVAKKGAKGKSAAAVDEQLDSAELDDADKPTDVLARAIGKPPADYKAPVTADGQLQTSPPTIPVSQFYTAFPEGEIFEYGLDSNTQRKTAAEYREKEKLDESMYNELREAAEVHRQCRHDIQKYIRPGVALIDIANQLETSTKTLLRANGLERGWGFPTGLSLNHIAAHFSPNGGDKTILKESDVLKVDFGTHINGRIIDCAFTVHFDEKYDPLVEAVKDATNTGIKVAGIDMRLGDIGGAIQEVMESYEIELDGKTMPIRCIRNLNGHSIAPYKIHAGKSVPIINNHDQTKMEEGEMYAIETFGSTGRGNITEDGEVSHYMRSFTVDKPLARSAGAVKLWNVIDKNFSTLAFCRRWLDGLGQKNYMLSLKQLVDAGAVDPYPPLVENKGAYTAQFEHTILLRPTCKEVLSRSFDY